MKSVPLGAFQPLDEKSGIELPVCAIPPAISAIEPKAAVATMRRFEAEASFDTCPSLRRGSITRSSGGNDSSPPGRSIRPQVAHEGGKMGEDRGRGEVLSLARWPGRGSSVSFGTWLREMATLVAVTVS